MIPLNRVENPLHFTQLGFMKLIRFFISAVIVGLLVAGCGKSAPPAPVVPVQWEPTSAQPRLASIKLYVGAAEITAEMALAPKEIMSGMMFRTNVVENEGMIFRLNYPQRASFWMKNCPKPLSCAYIDPQGTILEIREMEANNTNSVVSNFDNILFVLETAPGWFERHGVRTGMVIQSASGPLIQTLRAPAQR